MSSRYNRPTIYVYYSMSRIANSDVEEEYRADMSVIELWQEKIVGENKKTPLRSLANKILKQRNLVEDISEPLYISTSPFKISNVVLEKPQNTRRVRALDEEEENLFWDAIFDGLTE